MKSLKILCSSYKPNTAPTNRLLSFLSAFDSKGLKTEMVFVYPDESFSRLDISYNNISVTYLWDKHPFSNKYIKFLCSFIDIKQYANSLKENDSVLVFGSTQYLDIITRSKAKVYHERTEHPSIVPVTPKFLQKRYLRACTKLHGLFVISTALKTYFEELGVCNVRVVNMTVDAARFKNIDREDTQYPYIAYCGTASNNKDGVDVLIKAFSIVHSTHPEYKLYIIGKAPTRGDEAGNLELVERLNIANCVIFTGVIPASDMPQQLVNASVLALARPDNLQARCGFPTKLGEYLLSKRPVVVTKVGDIPKFLEDGKSAYLAEENDPDSFASKLLSAIEDQDTSNKIAIRGAEVANDSFNNVIEAQKIIDSIFK